jgi:peptidoglycan/LPS O-acetylase OafA/YrhL
MQTKSKTEIRIPILDGLRGVAIALVMAVHFMPDYQMDNRFFEWIKKAFHAGWVGVDLFFVLSGFLITNILLKTKDLPSTAKIFYARRALRILPLYMGALIVIFLILPLFGIGSSDPNFAIIQSHQFWYWIHGANLIALIHGFPAMQSDTVSLSHFWSLAVEEHFYLIWPLLVWKLYPKTLFRVALALIIIPLAIRLGLANYAIGQGGDLWRGILVQSPIRFDALAMGSILAIHYQANGLRIDPKLKPVAWALIALAFSILTVAFFILKGLWPGHILFSTIGLTLILLAFGSWIVLLLSSPNPKAFPAVLINNKPLRFLGKYSYGIYVLHGVLGPWMNYLIQPEKLPEHLGSPMLAAIVCIVFKSAFSITAALISWHILEYPFLKLKRHFSYTSPTTKMPEI